MKKAASKKRLQRQHVPDKERLKSAPDFPTLARVAGELQCIFRDAAASWDGLSKAQRRQKAKRVAMAAAGTDYFLFMFLVLSPPQRRGVRSFYHVEF